MPLVKYIGVSRRLTTRAFDGLSFATGETKDVSDAAAEWLLARDDFERADADEKPSLEAAVSGSIADLEDALETGAYDDRLGALESVEGEDKGRSGAYDAINARRDELEDDGDGV